MPKPIDVDTDRTERPPRGETRRPRTPPKVPPQQQPADDTPKPKPRSVADRKLGEAVAEMYQGIGMSIVGVGAITQNVALANSGAHIVNTSELAAEAWLDLADKNPKVKAALKKYTEVSAVGTLVMVHISMAAPLAATGGLIPANLANMIARAEVIPQDPTPSEPSSPNGHVDGSVAN